VDGEGAAHPLTSVKDKDEGGDRQKSGPSIRAQSSVNERGAKGSQFGVASPGDMARRRAKYAHGNVIDSLHTNGA